MAERDREDSNRDEQFPEQGITITDHSGLNEAYQKYNRRKVDDKNSKYRQRSTDNVRGDSGERGNSSRGKPLVFGSKKKTA